MYLDLKRITLIRNAFAHKPGAHDFEAQPVCNYVNELQLPLLHPKKEDVWPMNAFIGKAAWREHMLQSSGIIDDKPRRSKFLRTVEIVLTHLAIEIGEISFDQPIRPAGTGQLSS